MSHFNVYGRMRLCIVEALQKFFNAKPPFPVRALRVRDFIFLCIVVHIEMSV